MDHETGGVSVPDLNVGHNVPMAEEEDHVGTTIGGRSGPPWRSACAYQDVQYPALN